MIIGKLRARLFGYRATSDGDSEFGPFYCTLGRRHLGRHETWGCTCAGGGRCREPDALVATWLGPAGHLVRLRL